MLKIILNLFFALLVSQSAFAAQRSQARFVEDVDLWPFCSIECVKVDAISGLWKLGQRDDFRDEDSFLEIRQMQGLSLEKHQQFSVRWLSAQGLLLGIGVGSEDNGSFVARLRTSRGDYQVSVAPTYTLDLHNLAFYEYQVVIRDLNRSAVVFSHWMIRM